MIVTGIRTYTPIRQSQNFVGKKKDVPNNKKLFKKSDLKALEKKLIEVRDNPDFLRRLQAAKKITEAKIEERRRSSKVTLEDLRKIIITI